MTAWIFALREFGLRTNGCTLSNVWAMGVSKKHTEEIMQFSIWWQLGQWCPLKKASCAAARVDLCYMAEN